MRLHRLNLTAILAAAIGASMGTPAAAKEPIPCDPKVWAEPWGGEYEFSRSPGVYEYACHEGNYAMVHGLQIGRMQDAGLIPKDKPEAAGGE